MKLKTKIKIANFVIEVEHLFDLFQCLSQDYLTHQNPDYKVVVSEKDIEDERKFLRYCNVEDADVSSDAQIELTYIYRKICDCLVQKNANAFHGSAISVDGQCIIFAGQSGVGKSTQSALWIKHLDNIKYINDDKPLLLFDFDSKEIEAFGNPWSGKHQKQNNISAKVKAIVFVDQAKSAQEVSVKAVSDDKKIELLYPQFNIPTEKQLAVKVLDMINVTSRWIDIYSAKLDMTSNSVNVVYDTIFK